MKRLHLSLLALSLLLAGTMGCGRTELEHIPAEIARPYEDLFAPGQVRPGWNRIAVKRNPNRPWVIKHVIEVQPETAGEVLMKRGNSRDRLVAEIACPPSSEPIWSELEKGQDIEIELVSQNGTFLTVGCRAQVF